jgi:hypothetical protein
MQMSYFSLLMESAFTFKEIFWRVAAGAFPGAEFETNGEITHLVTEYATVLQVLFGLCAQSDIQT